MIPTCFLFVESLDEAHCLSVRLDNLENLNAPLAHRTAEEFRSLQVDTQTIVVLPTHLCSLYELELPKLSESKVRAAIPYILEDQLAEPVTNLHFALMRQSGESNRFLIVVVNKQVIAALIQRLSLLDIVFDEITLDWFALEESEACLLGHQLLIHAANFKGAVGVGLMTYVLKQHTPLTILTFSDSIPLTHTDTVVALTDNAYEWIAQRLLQRHFLNICQGDFSHDSKQRQTRRWFMFAGIMVGVWFLVNMLLKVVLLLMLKHDVSRVERQIAAVYHEFFPQAHAVVSPRFRIEKLLKEGQVGADATLWRLLEQLPAAVFPEGGTVYHSTLRIRSLRYQSGGLLVNLECNDFAILEDFEHRLHQQHVVVRQLSASQKEKHVVAALELK